MAREEEAEVCELAIYIATDIDDAQLWPRWRGRGMGIGNIYSYIFR